MGALATRGQLRDRHSIEDGQCIHCVGQTETIVHAVYKCSIVASIWAASPFQQLLTDCTASSFVDLFLWLNSKLDRMDLLSFANLAWAAWSFRNSVHHDEPWPNAQVGALGFLRLVHDYKGYGGAVFARPHGVPGVISRASWIPPGEGVVRINTDASILGDDGVGLEVVVRDSTGRVRVVVVRRVQARWTASLAEAAATKFGLLVTLELGYGNVELEVDALNLVKALHVRSFGRAPIDLLYEDISLLGDGFTSFTVSHVKRGGNSVAHLIARYMSSNGYEQLYVDDFPQGVLALAELDLV